MSRFDRRYLGNRWLVLAGSVLAGLSMMASSGPAQGADASSADQKVGAEATAPWAPEPGSPEQILFERAQAYWEARTTKGDISSFFPVNKRGRRWVRQGSFGTNEYQILGAYVDGDQGIVRVRTKIQPRGRFAARIKTLPEDMQQEMLYSTSAQKWQRIDDDWFIKRSRSGLSRFMKRRPGDEGKTTGEAAESRPEAVTDHAEGNN